MFESHRAHFHPSEDFPEQEKTKNHFFLFCDRIPASVRFLKVFLGVRNRSPLFPGYDKKCLRAESDGPLLQDIVFENPRIDGEYSGEVTVHLIV